MTRLADMAPQLTIARLNSLEREEFVRFIGPVFEHSPWIAEATWPRRPFKDREDLHRALRETVEHSSDEQKLALICAHPDLVGRAALAGSLTPQSASEQSQAGLTGLASEEIALFHDFNRRYREKFGFPFVICARLNKKQAILDGFRLRLAHSRPEEVQAALDEIYKIAYLRLQDMLEL
jgi:OHCU decarboxylase